MSRTRRPAFPLPLMAFWFRRLLPMWLLIAFLIFLMQIAICGIIHDNESREILNHDFPYCLHAQFFKIHNLNRQDVVFCQNGCGTTY